MPCLFPKYALLPTSDEAMAISKKPIFLSKEDYEIYQMRFNYPRKRLCKFSFKELPPFLTVDEHGVPDLKPMIIGCGTCFECKKRKATQWAVRMSCEASLYPDVDDYNFEMVSGSRNWFLTLTYDDISVPHSEVNYDLLTTQFDDVSEFKKRLRSYYDYNFPDEPPFRDFECSEYGDTTWRPHYHLILFNFKLFDAKYKFSNFQGDRFYTSAILQKEWRHGFVVASPMNFQTALYTARYTNKKVYGDVAVDLYDKNGLERMSTRMSRKPGIGFPWFEQNKEKIFASGEIILPDGRIYYPPDAFIKKYLDSADYQSKLDWYRNKARIVEGIELRLLNELEKTSLPEEEYFMKKSLALQEKAKKFKRDSFEKGF